MAVNIPAIVTKEAMLRGKEDISQNYAQVDEIKEKLSNAAQGLDNNLNGLAAKNDLVKHPERAVEAKEAQEANVSTAPKMGRSSG